MKALEFSKNKYLARMMKLAVIATLTLFVFAGCEKDNPIEALDRVATVSSLDDVANLPNAGRVATLIITGTHPDLTNLKDVAEYLPNIAHIVLPDFNRPIPDSLFFISGSDENDWLESFSAPKATGIGIRSFFNCVELAKIDVPNATFIGILAFHDCGALEHVSFPIVERLEGQTFEGCVGLISADLPTATFIGNRAFDECESLVLVNLPRAIVLGDRVFARCASLTSISLPRVTTIGSRVFENSISLEIVHLPSLVVLGDRVFVSCESLQSIYLCVNAPLTYGTELFEYGIFDGIERVVDASNISLHFSSTNLPTGNHWAGYTFGEIFTCP